TDRPRFWRRMGSHSKQPVEARRDIEQATKGCDHILVIGGRGNEEKSGEGILLLGVPVRAGEQTFGFSKNRRFSPGKRVTVSETASQMGVPKDPGLSTGQAVPSTQDGVPRVGCCRLRIRQ